MFDFCHFVNHNFVGKVYYNIDSKTKNSLVEQLLFKFGKTTPSVVCLGSDCVLSDMVGVFVADYLRHRRLKAKIFGGKNNIVLKKDLPKVLQKAGKNVLFVDSGALKTGKIAFCDNGIKFFDGTTCQGASLVANTIKIQNGKVLLCGANFGQVLNYAQFLGDTIVQFFASAKAISMYLPK